MKNLKTYGKHKGWKNLKILKIWKCEPGRHNIDSDLSSLYSVKFFIGLIVFKFLIYKILFDFLLSKIL